MDGFNVLEDSITGTSLQYRVLRVLLTGNLPDLHYGLQQSIARAFDAEIRSSEEKSDGEPHHYLYDGLN